ncbi:helix-turn-helix domain-containing protein [Lactobacillus delbrueckii]|uniref:helix-turn-helix domain-containing protein n=1 Tax=Lactobacillus delbrueckii TaxID=1584 RepID=UPI0035CF9ADE
MEEATVILPKGRLKYLRKQKRMSQEQVARKVGLSTGAYGIFERGERPVSVKYLHEIAQTLGVDVPDLKSGETQYHSEDKVTVGEQVTRDMKARLDAYAEVDHKSLTDSVVDALELVFGQGSDFDEQLHTDAKLIEIYNEKRKLVGLKPLKSVQLKANLSSMLNDNSIEDIITTLKELQCSQN